MNVSLVLVLLAEAAGPLLVAGHLGLLARRAPDRAVVPLEGGGGHLPRVLTLVLLPGNVKYFCMNCTFLSTVAFLLFLLELQFGHHILSQYYLELLFESLVTFRKGHQRKTQNDK